MHCHAWVCGPYVYASPNPRPRLRRQATRADLFQPSVIRNGDALLRNKLAMEGKTPDEITQGIQAAYSKGELPKRDGVSFAYMWSADQNLGSFGHWHPHMMVFCPYYENSMLGDNPLGTPSFRSCRTTLEHHLPWC